MIARGRHKVPRGNIAMVITFLEMTRKPPQRTADIPQGLTLAPWPDPPLEDYRRIMRRIGQDWLWYGRLSLSDNELRRRIHAVGVEMYCLWKADAPLALVELKFSADECELSFFGVDASLIGTTAARHLMSFAIDEAWSKPIKRFHLNTCTLDSPKALDFYRRSGFVEYDRAVEVVTDPRLNGVLPRDAAPNIAILE